jgi:hypothetical protein
MPKVLSRPVPISRRLVDSFLTLVFLTMARRAR